VSVLDDEVNKRRPQQPAPDQDRPRGILEPVTPWAEPVDGDQLLCDLVRTIQRFLVLSEEQAITIALWIVFAHAHDAADHSPILAIESPEKRCGKTTLLGLIAEIVSKPLSAANVTTAAVFRAIEQFAPTLLLDEVETYLRNNSELRGVLDSGFTRSSAYVIRTVGEQHGPKTFSTWCPKVAALIGELPPTIQDRSLVVKLRRRLPKETIERFGKRDLPDLHAPASRTARWVQDHMQDLRLRDPELPAALSASQTPGALSGGGNERERLNARGTLGRHPGVDPGVIETL
jgi:putative DNA primase/helicase